MSELTRTFVCQGCGVSVTRRMRGSPSKWCAACRPNGNRSANKSCPTCGRVGVRYDATYCSRKCSVHAQAHLHPRRAAATRRATQARRGRRGSVVWQEGPCSTCGERFTAKGKTRFCSTRCANQAVRERKRGRHAIRRQWIFERDGFVCGICGEPTTRTATVPHPLAPTIDHIIPSNRGGTNDPANLQCAHLSCNSAKGDRLPPHSMHPAA